MKCLRDIPCLRRFVCLGEGFARPLSENVPVQYEKTTIFIRNPADLLAGFLYNKGRRLGVCRGEGL